MFQVNDGLSVLVTGGAGFIGSEFVRLLQAKDIPVKVYDKLTYCGSMTNLVGPYQFCQGDICDHERLVEFMRDCQYVVNFAAESHVDRSISDPNSFLSTNVLGVNSVLKAAVTCKNVERVLLVSTDEVYGSIERGSFSEVDPVSPRNPYSASKASGELLGKAYFETYGLDVVITRGTNTYGPRQYPEKALPLFVTNAIDQEPIPIYGDGLNIRDWLHVTDHCKGILCALHSGDAGEVYNIAGEEEKFNIELVSKILEITQRSTSLIQHIEDRAGHDRRYSITSAKLKELGWKPTMSWDRGMYQTVKWYQENESWWRPIKSGEFKDYYERQYRDKLK